MSKGISLAGFWLWPWAVWHVMWIAGLVVVATMGVDPVTWFTWLYAAFLPLEIAGAIDVHNDTGRERAKTLSQWRQYVAQLGKADTAGWLSWKAVAGGSGLVDATLVMMLVRRNLVGFGEAWSWTAAILVGTTLALWLVPHFGWRDT